MKGLESLKYYTFTLRRNKAVKNYRALKFWAKRVNRRVMACFRVYTDYKRGKKQVELRVLKERERSIKQALLFKMAKTA